MNSYSGFSFYGFEHGVLIFFALSLSVYLVCKKREFDVFFLAGSSALLFSFPLLIGTGLAGPPGWPVVAPEPELYFVFSFFYVFILGFAFLNDAIYFKALFRERSGTFRVKKSMMTFVFFSWSLLFLWLIYDQGINLLFMSSKRELIDSSGMLLAFFVWLSVVFSTLFFYYGSKISKVLAVVVVLVGVLLGFRIPLVISFLVLVLLYGRDYGKVSLLKKFPVLMPVILIASVLFVSLAKPFYAQFKHGGMEGVAEALSSRGLVDIALSGMEFMRTQYVFNEVVLEGYSTDGGHIIRGPLSFLPIPRSLYTTPSSEFNDLFQADLFSGHKSGMAYNPFAEFYAAAGLVGVFVYIIMLLITIQAVAFLVQKRDVWSVFWSIVAVLLAFYFHRNSVAVTFGFVRNVFWPFFGFWLVSLFFCYVVRYSKEINFVDKGRKKMEFR